MARQKGSPKEPTTSLLDSAFYQSALRANRLEDNRLSTVQFRLGNDFRRQYLRYDNISRNSYDWAMQMKKTSGRTFPIHPSRMKEISARPKTVAESTPSCCVLYGMIIGERPVLLKNFLGRKPRKKKKDVQGREKNSVTRIESEEDEGENGHPVRSSSAGMKTLNTPKPQVSESPRDSVTGEIFKTFMYDNKLVTQVPIGYSRSSVRPHTSFVAHTSEMLRPENTKIPAYYIMRHKYILPPVGLCR